MAAAELLGVGSEEYAALITQLVGELEADGLLSDGITPCVAQLCQRLVKLPQPAVFDERSLGEPPQHDSLLVVDTSKVREVFREFRDVVGGEGG